MYHYTGLGREKQVSFPRLRRNFLFSLSWRFFPKQFSKKHLLFLAPSAKILLLYKNPIKRVPFCGAFDRRGGLGAASTPGVLLYRGCFYPAFPASKRRCRLMAKCDICGKGVTFGIKVSHSHRRSNRTWKPNPPPHLRLHPVLAFRQGPARPVRNLDTKQVKGAEKAPPTWDGAFFPASGYRCSPSSEALTIWSMMTREMMSRGRRVVTS